MINSFLSALKSIENTPSVRIIVIRGMGKSFCSGADLVWMARAGELDFEDNVRECEALARCFFNVYNSSKITLCALHGSCIGGALGFASSADVTIAADTTFFAFTEVRVGLVPAVILPFVLQKLEQSVALEKILTAARFSAHEAFRINLINRIAPEDILDEGVAALANEILKGEPGAQMLIKEMIRNKAGLIDEHLMLKNAEILARTRISTEATDRITSFFAQRDPSWINHFSNTPPR